MYACAFYYFVLAWPVKRWQSVCGGIWVEVMGRAQLVERQAQHSMI